MKWQQWIDNNIIKLLSIVYIAFIPLYPKFPMHQFIDTYIAVRLEDLFMVIYVAVFGLQVFRKKITLKTTLLWWFVAFWSAAFVSAFIGSFVLDTIIFEYLGFLHAARRVEYMIAFFIIISSIQSKKDFFFYLNIILTVMTIASLYGIGQKFFGFPAVQTMNKEFAQGILLFLRPDDRVSSTFAGHYDLAAYLVLLIPIAMGAHMYFKKNIYAVAVISGIYVLILTASRSSSGAFVASILVYLLFMRKWRYLIFVVTITAVFVLGNEELVERVGKTFRVQNVFVNQETGEVLVPQDTKSRELPVGTSLILKERSEDGTVQEGATGSTGIGEIDPNSKDYQLLRKQLREQLSADAKREGRAVTKAEIEEQIDFSLSNLQLETAYAADISVSTRFNVSWPRAINALATNPFFGTGPSSITEATDGSYFRWYGEFGIVGTALFSIILTLIFWRIAEFVLNTKDDVRILFAGFLAGMLGLAINATYIDVFEASKVAFTFWIVAGLFFGSLELFQKKVLKK